MGSTSQQEKYTMQTTTLTTGAVLTLAAAVALMPSNANAQDLMPDLECSAQVLPAQLQTGAEAVRVTVTLSEDIGHVTGVEEENAHGILVASPMDVPRAPMAAGEPAPTPIQMGDDETSWTFWLNTSEAEEGTQSIVFVAGENRCEAELEIVAPTG
jgi:hypothetical protein